MRRFVLRLTGRLLACTLLVCVYLRHRQILAQQQQRHCCPIPQEVRLATQNGGLNPHVWS
jgi:hypothetical protein